MIEEIRFKLEMFEVPLAGQVNVFCDNNGVVNKTSIPEFNPFKKHNATKYHCVREAAMAGILRVGKEDTATDQ